MYNERLSAEPTNNGNERKFEFNKTNEWNAILRGRDEWKPKLFYRYVACG